MLPVYNLFWSCTVALNVGLLRVFFFFFGTFYRCRLVAWFLREWNIGRKYNDWISFFSSCYLVLENSFPAFTFSQRKNNDIFTKILKKFNIKNS